MPRRPSDENSVNIERLFEKVAADHDYEPADTDDDRLMVTDPKCRLCGAPKRSHK